MSIIPDETLIVDQASVNGNENDHLNSEDSGPEADEDWGDIRRPQRCPPAGRTSVPTRRSGT